MHGTLVHPSLPPWIDVDVRRGHAFEDHFSKLSKRKPCAGQPKPMQVLPKDKCSFPEESCRVAVLGTAVDDRFDFACNRCLTASLRMPGGDLGNAIPGYNAF